MTQPVIEVCYAHHQHREENGTWQSSPINVAVTDVCDNAQFVEGTCPQCSSGEDAPFWTDMEQIWEDGGLAMIQHREMVGRLSDE